MEIALFDYLLYLGIFALLHQITNVIMKIWFPYLFVSLGLTFKTETIKINRDKFKRLQNKSKDGFSTMLKEGNQIIVFQNVFQNILGRNRSSILNIRASANVFNNSLTISHKISVIAIILQLIAFSLFFIGFGAFIALENWLAILFPFIFLTIFSVQSYLSIQSNHKRIRKVLLENLELDNKNE